MTDAHNFAHQNHQDENISDSTPLSQELIAESIGASLVDGFEPVAEMETGPNTDEPDTLNSLATIPVPILMEENVKLSECMLWKMLSDYYDQRGIDAWQEDTPNFITSSAFTAETYADLIIAFLKENIALFHPEEPVYILEMATGTGRFSYLLQKELRKKQAYFSALKDLNWVYLMTDFTQSQIDFWRSHQKLAPFIATGQLDFAIYNPLVADQPLQLQHSGKTLTPNNLVNPVIAIANYFFDSLMQDVFEVKHKTLLEGRVTLTRDLSKTCRMPNTPIKIQEVDVAFNYLPIINTKNYYGCPQLSKVLNSYKYDNKKGQLIFPVGALTVIKNLMQLTNNNLCLLASDKGFTDTEWMYRFSQHTFTEHGGSFSYMVNFDAIHRYFKLHGGMGYLSKYKEASLQTTAFVCLKSPLQENLNTEMLHYCFEERVNRGNTINSVLSLLELDFNVLADTFIALENDENRAYKNKGLVSSILALLRLSLNDPRAYNYSAECLTKIIQEANIGQVESIQELLKGALDSYYFYPGVENTPFDIATLYYQLRDYDNALACLDTAIEDFGQHALLYYLKGDCYLQMQQKNGAIACFEASLAINPENQTAIEALEFARKL
ncbi:MAG: tetratricopeptide repeat protein [Cyanobacteria bacterium P01_H01_bin.74]